MTLHRSRTTPSVERSRRPHLLVTVVLSVALIGGACSSQDPGLDPSIGGDAPAPSSNTLGQCPAGGPDETTSPAGCIDEDGQVVRN